LNRPLPAIDPCPDRVATTACIGTALQGLDTA
jgi:hypothetical protein